MRLYRGRLMWIMLGSVLIVLIVGAIAWALYMMLRQQPSETSTWQDPLAAVDSEAIATDLALYTLAGASVSETIDASIASGELETAYALLVHSLELSDAQRIGRLIDLGNRLAEAGSPERAGLCYQQVFDIAILSPRLSESIRGDALLAIGRGWMALRNETEAQRSYDQALLLAARGAYLPNAHRRELLGELEVAYRELDDLEQAEECLARIADLDRVPRLSPPRQDSEWPALPAGEEAVSSPAVGTYEEARRQAAYALLQALSSRDEPPAELVSRLAQALLEEDAAKVDLYRQALQSTTEPGRRSDIQLQAIRWLLVKYQAANRGFGLAAVPEWDAQKAAILTSLNKAFEDLLVEYEDYVAALPQADHMDPVRYEALRRLILAGRLGLYPDYPVERMAQDLEATAKAVIAVVADDQLYVEPVPDDGGWEFAFSPADQYGVSGNTP